MTIQNILLDQSYNEQIKLHGRTREAVLETIRVCRDRNILKDYLESREQEVVNIMMTLFDKEYILKTYIEQEKRDAAEEAAKQATQKVKRERGPKIVSEGNVPPGRLPQPYRLPDHRAKPFERSASGIAQIDLMVAT